MTWNKWGCWLASLGPLSDAFLSVFSCVLREQPGRNTSKGRILTNASPLFSSIGKRRGVWLTSTGLDLRIWLNASLAPWRSQRWSAGLTATRTRPRLVLLFCLIIKITAGLFVKSLCFCGQPGCSGPCPGGDTDSELDNSGQGDGDCSG